ncbi:oligopeptide transport system ATP-binding protein [Palleronia aestuarii]|uniref:Oligopeptide transport system ATP-binding protein n=1 Tax=Palleronia aestuarii TaxID=568105 RepID=A0A2W7NZW1_9RHOB|nr:ABC transporter ATP-binding protein [Palleronia aestuarii]PZX18766.1 oligopeptide transport system ATP-binding protein [Palleronia aestuarii]
MTERLRVQDLSVHFRSERREVQVVHDLSFTLEAGRTLALVGESGSGKSVTSLALMGLLPPPPQSRTTGSALLEGRDGADLLGIPESRRRRLRGDRIAMIFQEPLTSLNPVHSVGAQLVEAIRSHRSVSRRAAWDRAEELLDEVGIPEPAARLASFPHELSGGMRQRVMIAIALALEPDVLIADEPTTALDVTVQAQILDLLRRVQERTGMAMLFITHDFGVVADIAHRTVVMYAGRMVEAGPTEDILRRPLMPYTSGLMASVPLLETAGTGRSELATIDGFVPDPAAPPAGCAFHPRCAHNRPGRCDVPPIAVEAPAPDRSIRCARWRELAEEVR